jgi:cell division septum initiation protein DivIVA
MEQLAESVRRQYDESHRQLLQENDRLKQQIKGIETADAALAKTAYAAESGLQFDKAVLQRKVQLLESGIVLKEQQRQDANLQTSLAINYQTVQEAQSRMRGSFFPEGGNGPALGEIGAGPPGAVKTGEPPSVNHQQCHHHHYVPVPVPAQAQHPLTSAAQMRMEIVELERRMCASALSPGAVVTQLLRQLVDEDTKAKRQQNMVSSTFSPLR